MQVNARSPEPPRATVQDRRPSLPGGAWPGAEPGVWPGAWPGAEPGAWPGSEPGVWPGPSWPGFWPSRRRCWKRNEVYKQCVSSSCAEDKCWKKRFPFCTLDCNYGCYCKDGYYRNRWGQCVRKKECESDYTGGKPYDPIFTTRPSSYPGNYGPGQFGYGGFERL
nr:uncharacterized protein LOC126526072 [Dermacentor andersoni]